MFISSLDHYRYSKFSLYYFSHDQLQYHCRGHATEGYHEVVFVDNEFSIRATRFCDRNRNAIHYSSFMFDERFSGSSQSLHYVILPHYIDNDNVIYKNGNFFTNSVSIYTHPSWTTRPKNSILHRQKNVPDNKCQKWHSLFMQGYYNTGRFLY